MACVYEAPILTLDQQTAELIFQLQLQDAEMYFSSSKGKGREGDVSDESLAFELQRQEIEAMSKFCTDSRMARSMACAVMTDGQALTDSLLEEDTAAQDRQIAHQLSDGIYPSSKDNHKHNTEADTFENELLEKLRVLYISGFDDSSHNDLVDELDYAASHRPESSAWAASRATKSSSTNNRRCEACREDVHFVDVARLPCRHEYCRVCLGELFEASMTDESLFPPRCCREPIPVTSVRLFLKEEVVRTYEHKKIEFETPNRTYCYSPNCSAFIHPRNISDETATCSDCALQTCTTCKARAHDGDCPNDTALQQMLETARENGWQRCHSCWRVVELEHGCNHMTYVPPLLVSKFAHVNRSSCRCGAQFCYVCGEPWKNCACEQWDEHRLYARATQIVDRQDEPVAAAPAPTPIAEGRMPLGEAMHRLDEREAAEIPADDPAVVQNIRQPSRAPEAILIGLHAARNREIARTIQNLRENHECEHSNWRWVKGRHKCEECYHTLPQYIFECGQCQLQACNRCRRNRL